MLGARASAAPGVELHPGPGALHRGAIVAVAADGNVTPAPDREIAPAGILNASCKHATCEIEALPAVPGGVNPVNTHVDGGDSSSSCDREWPAQLDRETLDAVFACAEVPPEWREELAAVAWCESRWRPGAVGDGGASLGLAQLWRGWYAYAGEDVERWADPVVNARVAVAVVRYSLERGQTRWEQWSCRP